MVDSKIRVEVNMDILFEVEKGLIVIVSLLMAYAEFSQAIKYRHSWVKWGLGFMGIYWAGIRPGATVHVRNYETLYTLFSNR